MGVKIKLDIKREINLNCDYDTAFGVFANVPKTVSHFPKVEKLEDLGDGCYRWEMEKMGLASFQAQVVYACKYTHNKKEGWIRWSPVDGVGNGRNSGAVKITKVGKGVRVDFSTVIELDLPFSALMKPVVKPFVESEFQSLLQGFHKNLEKALGK